MINQVPDGQAGFGVGKLSESKSQDRESTAMFLEKLKETHFTPYNLSALNANECEEKRALQNVVGPAQSFKPIAYVNF